MHFNGVFHRLSWEVTMTNIEFWIFYDYDVNEPFVCKFFFSFYFILLLVREREFFFVQFFPLHSIFNWLDEKWIKEMKILNWKDSLQAHYSFIHSFIDDVIKLSLWNEKKRLAVQNFKRNFFSTNFSGKWKIKLEWMF